MPDSVIQAGRKDLRRRTERPEIANAGRQRARLILDSSASRSSSYRMVIGSWPSTTATARRILALPEAIASASPARREELCRVVVERVVVADRQVVEIHWTAPAQPFLKRQRECPQGGSSTRPLSDDDVLAWYVA